VRQRRARLFIAQAYNMELMTTEQITMLLLLMLPGKAWPACHAPPLVVIAATRSSFNPRKQAPLAS
jgi:Na+/H+-dicarboxylate symporter